MIIAEPEAQPEQREHQSQVPSLRRQRHHAGCATLGCPLQRRNTVTSPSCPRILL